MIKNSQKLFNIHILNKITTFRFGSHGEIDREKIILRN
jgi:hypothetical protein